MSQIFSQIPRHLLAQQQRLTPQLIQAMDILQLNALALESRLSQELDANPALELVPPDEEPTTEPADEADAPVAPPNDPPADAQTQHEAENFERLDTLVREYDWLDDEYEYRGTRSRARGEEEGDVKLEAMANTAERPISLQEHLLRQWHLAEVNPEISRLGTRIIEDLDEIGRLVTPLESLAQQIEPAPSAADVAAALRAVQRLDPPGIAARTLQECLLLQIEALSGENELERRVIAEHFEDLQKNRLPAIAKALGVEVSDVQAAIRVIGRLSLHPGLDVAPPQVPTIVPDVVVDYDEQAGEYTVRLTRGNLRELRISREFREALEQSRGDKSARDFLKSKLEAASAIIDAVRYRRERLLDVARAVVEAQRDFLEQGEQHLKVLRMSDLAERFGCDPSTISRTVDEKYVQTPRGIYPLRWFFTGGTESDDGEALGWESIKAKVQEIVASEDKRAPLSDDQIVDRLRDAGIEIKRRTVAKYRAQLAIPTARQRKQY